MIPVVDSVQCASCAWSGQGIAGDTCPVCDAKGLRYVPGTVGARVQEAERLTVEAIACLERGDRERLGDVLDAVYLLLGGDRDAPLPVSDDVRAALDRVVGRVSRKRGG